MIADDKKRITITIDLDLYNRIVKFCQDSYSWYTKSECCSKAIRIGLDCLYHEARGGLVRFD